MRNIIIVFLVFLFAACQQPKEPAALTLAEYHKIVDSGVQTGGVKMIPITTPVGKFNVWTKRFGNNPNIKVLLLHGGPGGSHEFFESFESYFPQQGFEFYEYDQLGSYFSDKSKDSSL
jgi:proline iminopeptidase